MTCCRRLCYAVDEFSDEETAKFTPVFKEYVQKGREIKAKYRPDRHKRATLSDGEIDAAIRKEFKKSQEILNLRVEYYEKFSKVLSARQILEMYKIEQENIHKAQYNHYKKNNHHDSDGKCGFRPGPGKHPHKHPGQCPEK